MNVVPVARATIPDVAAKPESFIGDLVFNASSKFVHSALF